jgi:hypothetical protein
MAVFIASLHNYRARAHGRECRAQTIDQLLLLSQLYRTDVYHTNPCYP